MNATVFADVRDSGQVNDQVSGHFGWLIATAALTAGRTFCIVFFSAIALLQAAFIRPRAPASRARWLHRWCRFACRVLNVSLATKGRMPCVGLLVCNHLSYLDVIALSALAPCVFVAKCEVRDWPLFGWLARAAGTIFVDRHRRSGASREVEQIREALDSGLLVVLFPEGTSTDGNTVLPFKSTLFQAAVECRTPIAAAGLDYYLSHGSVADEVCYWRDMTLVPHLVNLLGKAWIDAEIRFSPAQVRATDRKLVARELRAEVIFLRR